MNDFEQLEEVLQKLEELDRLVPKLIHGLCKLQQLGGVMSPAAKDILLLVDSEGQEGCDTFLDCVPEEAREPLRRRFYSAFLESRS